MPDNKGSREAYVETHKQQLRKLRKEPSLKVDQSNDQNFSHKAKDLGGGPR